MSSALAMPSPVRLKPISMMWPGLLAAERPAARAQLLEHVAVADAGIATSIPARSIAE